MNIVAIANESLAAIRLKLYGLSTQNSKLQRTERNFCANNSQPKAIFPNIDKRWFNYER